MQLPLRPPAAKPTPPVGGTHAIEEDNSTGSASQSAAPLPADDPETPVSAEEPREVIDLRIKLNANLAAAQLQLVRVALTKATI